MRPNVAAVNAGAKPFAQFKSRLQRLGAFRAIRDRNKNYPHLSVLRDSSAKKL
jgi:hypothetical protein